MLKRWKGVAGVASVRLWLLISLGLGASCASGAWAQPPQENRQQTQVPAPNAPAGELLLLRAEQIVRNGDTITCVGNVEAEVQGLKLDCHWLEYDLVSGQVRARQECLFRFGESFAASDEIDLNLQLKEASLRRVVGRGSDLTSNSQAVEQPLLFWAKSMRWTPEIIELQEASVTTCDKLPGRWDYRIEAERIDIYPGDRLEAFNTSVDLGGFRPLTLANLTFSLDPSRPLLQDYLPTVGFSAIFGGFVRTTIPYNFNRRNLGKIHLDYFTRTGFSGGLEQRINWDDRLLGEIYYYQQPGVNGQSGRLDFRTNAQYRFDDFTTANFLYSRNRFELPNFTSPLTIANQFGITRQTDSTLIQLQTGFSRSGDNTNTVHLGLLRSDLDERTRFLAEADNALATTLGRRTSRTHYLAALQHHHDWFDFEAALENNSGPRTYFLNRNPELRLASRPLYLGEVPLLASASFGRITESPSRTTSNRWDLRLTVPDQMVQIGTGRLLLGGGVRQFSYDTGQSQRVWLARASAFQPIGESFSARIDFNLQDPSGSTPFLHDFHTPYSVVTGGLEVFDSGAFRLGAFAGYDLLRKQAHDLVARLDVQPSPEFSLSSGSNYDPIQSRWRSIDNLVSLRLGDSLSLSHWSLYDFQKQRMAYQDIMLNFESHDWVASVAYRGLQQEVFFQLSLNGFPAPPLHIGPEAGLPVLPNNLANPFVR